MDIRSISPLPQCRFLILPKAFTTRANIVLLSSSTLALGSIETLIDCMYAVVRFNYDLTTVMPLSPLTLVTSYIIIHFASINAASAQRGIEGTISQARSTNASRCRCFPGTIAGHPSWSGQHSTTVFMASLLPPCLWRALVTMTSTAPTMSKNAPNYSQHGSFPRRIAAHLHRSWPRSSPTTAAIRFSLPACLVR